MLLEFFKENFILSGAWILVVILIIASLIADRFSGVQPVGNSMLSMLTNKKDAIIVDIRNEKDFRSGHIVNSMNILVGDIDKDNLGKLKLFKNPVIVVDQTGLNSMSAAKKLSKKGFKPAYYLKEGINGWLKDNLPLTKK